SVGTHPTVTTCKPNTEKTPRFLRIREGSSLGRLVMTGVGALTRSLPLRRRDFRGAETLRQSAGVTRESARGQENTKPRSDIYRGEVLGSVRERTTRELMRLLKGDMDFPL